MSTGNEHFPSKPEEAVDDGSMFWQLPFDLNVRRFLKTTIKKKIKIHYFDVCK